MYCVTFLFLGYVTNINCYFCGKCVLILITLQNQIIKEMWSFLFNYDAETIWNEPRDKEHFFL